MRNTTKSLGRPVGHRGGAVQRIRPWRGISESESRARRGTVLLSAEDLGKQAEQKFDGAVKMPFTSLVDDSNDHRQKSVVSC